MKNRLGRRALVVLLISLLAANCYVEYGRKVRASETAGEEIPKKETDRSEKMVSGEATDDEGLPETESESETKTESEAETEKESGEETESESETETETEAETEKESGEETGAESETERETENGVETETEGSVKTGAESEVEPETEREEETETKPDMEAEKERESETVSEPETVGETESAGGEETERETEPESWVDTENESETERSITIIYISNIQVVLPEGGRIYDGTDQIKVSYETALMNREVEGEEVLSETAEQEMNNIPDLIDCEAGMEGVDAGRQKVWYHFFLKDESGAYELQIEDANLEVDVLPRELEVKLPDGWKVYGEEVKSENIHLTGKVEVTGFLRDEDGNEVIPNDFEPPEVEVDSSVIRQWSDIYEKGEQKIYRDALVMKRDGEGKINGNPTANYCFPEERDSEKVHKGNMVIHPAEVVLDRDFELAGEEQKYCREENGTVWVQAGTMLQAVPKENSGYNCGGRISNLQSSGTFVFQLFKKNKAGEITAASLPESIEYQVDGFAPEAVFQISGAMEEDGIYYGKDSAVIRIQIPEDNGSGIRSARYFVAASKEAFDNWGEAVEDWWQDCSGGTELSLQENGSYTVYVETEDCVGNRAVGKSMPVILDNTQPELEIIGVEDGSANAGKLSLTVRCADPIYKTGSMKVSMEGANGGTLPEETESSENEGGAEISFSDFLWQKASDDIYTLRAEAEDLAGNRTEKQITFSVNRYGSVYDLAGETKEALKTYYHRSTFPVIFRETNIDYVGQSRIMCGKDGQVRQLEKGTEYTRTRSGGKTAWKQYRYTVDANVFSEEGSYEVLLLSEDRAKNSSDTQVQEKTVRFAIDRTAPECLITGLESHHIYQAGERWISLEARDNGRLREVCLFVNGEQAALYDGDKFEQDGIIKWKLEGKDYWQSVQVYAADEAGNEMWTEELPFYLTAGETDKIPPYEKTGLSAQERVELKEGKRSEEEAPEGEKTEILLQSSEKDISGVRLAGKFLAMGGFLAAGILLFVGLKSRGKDQRPRRKNRKRFPEINSRQGNRNVI